MNYTKDEKEAFIKCYQNVTPVIQMCNDNRIPRSTFYLWIQKILTNHNQDRHSLYAKKIHAYKKKSEKSEGIDG